MFLHYTIIHKSCLDEKSGILNDVSIVTDLLDKQIGDS